MKSKKYKESAVVFYAIIIALALGLPNMAFAGTIQLPKTGQTKCYDTSGAEISCTGTGQDGDIQAGVAWPNPRFVDNGDSTVSDKLTGLMWTKNANLIKTRNPLWDTNGHRDGAVTWQRALDYVAKLNNESYLGHTDWRLPNVEELKSLADSSQLNPSLPQGHPFTNVALAIYWSSTTGAYYPGTVFTIGMNDGFMMGSFYKSGSNGGYGVCNYAYAWPVRAGQCGSFGDSIICLPKTGQTKCYDTSGAEISCTGTGQDGDIQAGVAWPNPRFVDNGDSTVSDKLTGLVWTKDEAEAMTWPEALDYVKTLNTGGHTDWRLPNWNELQSIVDYSRYNPAIDTTFFPGSVANNYWTSTTHAYEYTASAWCVNFYVGGRGFYDKSTNLELCWQCYVYVRAVRGGDSLPTTSTTIPNVTTTTTTPISTTTTTTPKPPLCAAEAIYGEHSEQTELLREYRDKVLSKSPEGQETIKAYYKFSSTVTKLLEHNPLLKNRAKAFIDSMLLGIRKKVEESNKNP